MIVPARLQLSRAKGFDLQALSLATNGLSAVKVARPGRWGNPFAVKAAADAFDCRQESAHHHAVAWFKDWISKANDDEAFGDLNVYGYLKTAHRKIHEGLPDLRGKNLACFCRPGFACHADVLLEIANRMISKPVLEGKTHE